MKPAMVIDARTSLALSLARRLVIPARFELDGNWEGQRRQARAWLILGIAALVLSGVFSVLLVLARTPGVKELFPAASFFHMALVVHVDLSVLVWFASFAGMLWTLNSTNRFADAGNLAIILCAVGAVTLSAAPFFGDGEPIMANYVPVIDSPLFLSGLSIFGLGFGLLILRSLAVPARVGLPLSGTGALRFGLNTAAVAAAMALLALLASRAGMPSGYFGKPFYELLFWGPGHVIQFSWTLIMLVAWLWLATASGGGVPLSPRLVLLLFGIGLVSVFSVPVIYLTWDVAAPEHVKMHTWLMRVGGGLAILPVALAAGFAVLTAPRPRPEQKPLRAALLASMLLFALGGLFGFLIAGNDVRVPAHYHGCIVGVTLAMMGLTYVLLPRLGFASPQTRLASLQPWIYGIGQALHIAGLVWSGGYGVQRKVAGAAQVLRTPQEIAGMGLMGIGGLIAIVGGVLFLVVVFRAMLPVKCRQTDTSLPC